MMKNSITTSTTTTTNNNSSNCVPPEGSNTRKKQYKGVRMRSWGSWVSEIRAPNQKTRIWLGSYSTAEAAARAYDAALVCLKGPMAALNFPDSPPHYHLPPNPMSPKAIQAIAAAAANDIPTTTTTTTTNSSSPSSETIEDDMFTVYSGSGNGVSDVMEEEMAMEMPIDFGFIESPKCIEQVLDYWTVFETSQVDDCDYYEGDINLWSFC